MECCRGSVLSSVVVVARTANVVMADHCQLMLYAMHHLLLILLQVIDFYEYYEGLQEGWDGPALLVFSDGNKIGARLDRNGLRPARFWETDDGMVYVASEVGVLGDVLTNASHVTRKGRLGPGQMVCADLADVSASHNAVSLCLRSTCYCAPHRLMFQAVHLAICCSVYAHQYLECLKRYNK